MSSTLDTLISLKIKAWRTIHFKDKRVMIYCAILAVCILLLNTSNLIVNGYVTYANETQKIVCYAWLNNDYGILGRVCN